MATLPYTIAILGGGPAGLSAAQHAKAIGGRIAAIAPPPLGGTCLNWGCYPVHYLREAARLWRESPNGQLDWPAVLAAKEARLALLREQDARVLSGYFAMKWFPESGRFVGPHQVAVGDEVLTVANVLVATGARPAFTPEQEAVGAISPAAALALPSLPRSMLVLGSEGRCLEAAQILARFGVQVAVVETGERLAPEQERDVSQALTALLESDGVEVWTGVRLVALRREGAECVAILEEEDKERETTFRSELRAEVVVAGGRRGNTEALGLEAIGLSADADGYLPVDSQLRTAVDWVWGGGDVVGGPFLSSVAAQDGVVVVENVYRKADRQRDLSLVPTVINTDPRVARVGLGEAEAWEVGFKAKSIALPLSSFPAAIAEGNAQGMVKLVAEGGTELLLGAHIVAPHADELINAAALALRGRLTLLDLQEMLFASPTLSAAFRPTARAFFRPGGDVVPCCGD